MRVACSSPGRNPGICDPVVIPFDIMRTSGATTGRFRIQNLVRLEVCDFTR
jgi:hypothetical protein